MSATESTNQRSRRQRAGLRLLAAQLCDAGQGIHPAPPRPRLVRDDRDDPGDAAAAVRLRHQHHAAPSADGRIDPGGQRSGALGAEGAGEYQLLPLHPRSAQRRRVRRSPAVRQGAVRGRDPARLRTRGAARRQAGAAGRGGCDRSGRGRLCARLARHGGADRARARPPHRRSARRCRSRSGRMPATTRRRNRGSTSCRAWSAPS